MNGRCGHIDWQYKEICGAWLPCSYHDDEEDQTDCGPDQCFYEVKDGRFISGTCQNHQATIEAARVDSH